MDERLRGFLAAGEAAGLRYRLQLPREAMTGTAGFHTGRLSGASLEFRDYREYQPGDDPRTIDWNVYGRSDRLIVKIRHEEVSPHLDILLDLSPSMDLPQSTKAQGLLGLAALLATAAANAGCTHAAWMPDDGYQPVSYGHQPASLWEDLRFGAAGCPAEALRLPRPGWRRNGIRILLSDLLWDGDPLTVLRPLADGAARLVIIQLLAASDVTPATGGNTRLVDVETGAASETFIDALAVRAYGRRLAAHQQLWSQACSQAGATLLMVVAEEAVASWRLDALEQAGVLGAA